MAIYQTFLNHNIQRHKDRVRLLQKGGINFTNQSLDAGAGDVHEVIAIKPGTVVLSAFVTVNTAAPTNSTIDLGYGSVPNYWGTGLPIDTAGYASTIRAATQTVYPPDKIMGGDQWNTEVAVTGALYGDSVTVQSANDVDVADIALNGNVFRPGVVTVNLVNMSKGELSLPTMSLNVVVNRAPMIANPVLFGSSDTIDITATTDVQDVNITSGIISVKALVILLDL